MAKKYEHLILEMSYEWIQLLKKEASNGKLTYDFFTFRKMVADIFEVSWFS